MPNGDEPLRDFQGLRKAELHLHLEGSVAPATLVGLSRRLPVPLFPDLDAVRNRQDGLRDGRSFLELYRDVCRSLGGPADYRLLARDVVRRLHREGIRHAEVYVSPAVVERLGFSWKEVVGAIEPVFLEHERRRRGRIRVLLDSVRQWGPDVAHRVLDLHEEDPWRRVAGFGLGGDERAVAAREFAGVYRRVRKLGLAPLVHAGEWGGADSVADALLSLRPLRIAHGIRAVDDPAVVRRLVRSGVFLDVCLTSNAATGALREGEVHPVRRLLAAGVKVTLSTDDPGLFRTTLRREYAALASLGAAGRELRAVARYSWEGRLR